MHTSKCVEILRCSKLWLSDCSRVWSMMKLVCGLIFFQQAYSWKYPRSCMFVVLDDQVGILLQVLRGVITRKRYRSPDCEFGGVSVNTRVLVNWSSDTGWSMLILPCSEWLHFYPQNSTLCFGLRLRVSIRPGSDHSHTHVMGRVVNWLPASIVSYT